MSGSLTAARQKLPRRLTGREEKLDEMLDHFNEARETLQRSGQPGGGDGGLRLMGNLWHGGVNIAELSPDKLRRHRSSFEELDRCLTRMRGLAGEESSPGFRSRYWHLCEWYLRPVTVLRYKKLRKQGGKTLTDYVLCGDPRDRVRLIRRSVDEGGQAKPVIVLAAVEWIGLEFVGEPFLPSEILEPLAA